MLHLASQFLAVEGGEEESEDIFLLPNATFVVELLLFAGLLFVVWRYIVPPIAKAMADRQETIARQMTDNEAAARKLTEATAAYEDAMSAARGEASRLREEARAAHKAIVDEAATAAQAEADQITAQAREQLNAEREQAVTSLRGDVAELAGQLAGRIVGERV